MRTHAALSRSLCLQPPRIEILPSQLPDGGLVQQTFLWPTLFNAIDNVMALPTTLAIPAAAASLAYLNARWSVPNDWRLVSSLVRARIAWAKRVKKDQMNAFYPLETNAQSPKIKDGLFMIYESQSWTFRETYETTLRYAGWLHHTLGVKPKEIVAVDFMNSPHFIFLTLALWSLGAIPAYINYNLTGDPLIHSVRVSTARLLIVDPEVAHRITPEVAATFASPNFSKNAFPLEIIHLDQAFATSLPYFPPYRAPDSARSNITSRGPGVLIFTSGTTGLPKAAIIPWERLATTDFVSRWQGLRPVYSRKPDRYYTCMPLYHSSAFLCCFLPCLVSGTTMVLGHRFSTTKFWSDVRKSDVTVIQYVGETLRYLLAVPPQRDPDDPTKNLDLDNSVRLAFGNGLRPDVWDKFKARFGVETIAEFYAATEGTSGSWNYSSNDFASGAIGRNGKIAEILLGKEVAVVEVDWDTENPWRSPETGFCKKVPRGELGELLYAVDPDNIGEKYAGYFENEKASQSKIMRDVLKKGDAFFRTGDVMRWDKEGRWWFSDRIGDTFRWKSENVSTAEVSEALGRHPNVMEANVYGVTLPNHDGRAGCATILLDTQQPSQEVLDSIAKHVTANLPKYAVPIFLRLVPEIVATGNNKQQKSVLRNEGVDPALVAQHAEQKLFWLYGGRYVLFEPKDWDELKSGKARL